MTQPTRGADILLRTLARAGTALPSVFQVGGRAGEWAGGVHVGCRGAQGGVVDADSEGCWLQPCNSHMHLL